MDTFQPTYYISELEATSSLDENAAPGKRKTADQGKTGPCTLREEVAEPGYPLAVFLRTHLSPYEIADAFIMVSDFANSRALCDDFVASCLEQIFEYRMSMGEGFDDDKTNIHRSLATRFIPSAPRYGIAMETALKFYDTFPERFNGEQFTDEERSHIILGARKTLVCLLVWRYTTSIALEMLESEYNYFDLSDKTPEQQRSWVARFVQTENPVPLSISAQYGIPPDYMALSERPLPGTAAADSTKLLEASVESLPVAEDVEQPSESQAVEEVIELSDSDGNEHEEPESVDDGVASESSAPARSSAEHYSAASSNGSVTSTGGLHARVTAKREDETADEESVASLMDGITRNRFEPMSPVNENDSDDTESIMDDDDDDEREDPGHSSTSPNLKNENNGDAAEERAESGYLPDLSEDDNRPSSPPATNAGIIAQEAQPSHQDGEKRERGRSGYIPDVSEDNIRNPSSVKANSPIHDKGLAHEDKPGERRDSGYMPDISEDDTRPVVESGQIEMKTELVSEKAGMDGYLAEESQGVHSEEEPHEMIVRAADQVDHGYEAEVSQCEDQSTKSHRIDLKTTDQVDKGYMPEGGNTEEEDKEEHLAGIEASTTVQTIVEESTKTSALSADAVPNVKAALLGHDEGYEAENSQDETVASKAEAMPGTKRRDTGYDGEESQNTEGEEEEFEKEAVAPAESRQSHSHQYSPTTDKAGSDSLKESLPPNDSVKFRNDDGYDAEVSQAEGHSDDEDDYAHTTANELQENTRLQDTNAKPRQSVQDDDDDSSDQGQCVFRSHVGSIAKPQSSLDDYASQTQRDHDIERDNTRRRHAPKVAAASVTGLSIDAAVASEKSLDAFPGSERASSPVADAALVDRVPPAATNSKETGETVATRAQEEKEAHDSRPEQGLQRMGSSLAVAPDHVEEDTLSIDSDTSVGNKKMVDQTPSPGRWLHVTRDSSVEENEADVPHGSDGTNESDSSGEESKGQTKNDGGEAKQVIEKYHAREDSKSDPAHEEDFTSLPEELIRSPGKAAENEGSSSEDDEVSPDKSTLEHPPRESSPSDAIAEARTRTRNSTRGSSTKNEEGAATSLGITAVSPARSTRSSSRNRASTNRDGDVVGTPEATSTATTRATRSSARKLSTSQDRKEEEKKLSASRKPDSNTRDGDVAGTPEVRSTPTTRATGSSARKTSTPQESAEEEKKVASSSRVTRSSSRTSAQQRKAAASRPPLVPTKKSKRKPTPETDQTTRTASKETPTTPTPKRARTSPRTTARRGSAKSTPKIAGDQTPVTRSTRSTRSSSRRTKPNKSETTPSVPRSKSRRQPDTDSDSDSESEEATWSKAWKKAKLVEACTKRGLDPSGKTKDELIDLLNGSLKATEEEGSDEEATSGSGSEVNEDSEKFNFLNSHRVLDLKAALGYLGLSKDGKKADLVQRLADYEDFDEVKEKLK